MLENFKLDVNMFSNEYFNTDEDQKQFNQIADLLFNKKSPNRQHSIFKFIHLFSSGDDCPICDSEMVNADDNKSNHCVCHICGLESMLSLSGRYKLTMEDISWTIALSTEEPDDECTELLRSIQKSQGDVFALYRLVLNGTKVEDADTKIETMKTEIKSLCDNLSEKFKGMNQVRESDEVKAKLGRMEVDRIIQQYLSQK